MLTTAQWRERILHGECDAQLAYLYGAGQVIAQRDRYCGQLAAFERSFGAGEAALISAPGRSEIGGNHTDHQRGHVLAAAASLDILAVAAENGTDRVRIRSKGYPELSLSLSDLKPHGREKNTSAALVRGVLAGVTARGGALSGFDALLCSDVPKGSGLSSSAAYGILIGAIANGLFCDGRFSPVALAQMAQSAENIYFGKPSGLMDQLAAAEGGFVAIDFADPAMPAVRRLACDFDALGYTVCIVNAGGSHAGLTHEYAAIPREMGLVAAAFGETVLSRVPRAAFYARLGALRKTVPDRALLRAMHFFDEDARVLQQADALSCGDVEAFLTLVRASGRSSFELLQNVCPAGGGERSLALALAVAERALNGAGAVRVHGGGFAGTIQAFVPNGRVAAFAGAMESVFGAGACYSLRIRPIGGFRMPEDAARWQ